MFTLNDGLFKNHKDIDYAIGELRANLGEAPELYGALIQHLSVLSGAMQLKGKPSSVDIYFPPMDIDAWGIVIKRLSAIAAAAMPRLRHGTAQWFAHLTKHLADNVTTFYSARPEDDLFSIEIKCA